MSYLQGILPLHMVQKPTYKIEAPGYQPVEGETIPRRHPKAKDGLLQRPAPDVDTVFALVKRSAEKYDDEPAVGSRRLVQVHKEMKKVPKVVDGAVREVEKEWTFYELSKYSYLTHAEYFALVLRLGSGLRKLGLAPDDKLHIFASTSANRLSMSHACSSQSIILVTAYDSLGESGVQHSLTQTAATAMFVDPHLLGTATGALKAAPSVKYVIYNDESTQPVPERRIADFKAAFPDLSVVSVSELHAMGEAGPADPVTPAPDSTYCIMYTSGSSGMPKGVPVTHAGFVSAVAGLHAVVEDCVSQAEYVLAYLPLAHIFELVLENLVVFIGATLGYGSPRTLAASSLRNSAGDVREFRPTVMVGVPQIWETVRKGVAQRVDAGGSLVRALFWGALSLKSFLVRAGLPGQALLDGPVFGRVRQMTGGRQRIIVNGASGIADSTQHFMSMVVAPMISGYGQTKTSGNGDHGSPLQWTAAAIGPIPAAVEIKLASLPELDYSVDAAVPQGEILIRGAPVCAEYYEHADETATAFTADGWFRTGDIGEFHPNGHVKVIDRVKNLVKLQGGQYIALEKLEAIYRGAHEGTLIAPSP